MRPWIPTIVVSCLLFSASAARAVDLPKPTGDVKVDAAAAAALAQQAKASLATIKSSKAKATLPATQAAYVDAETGLAHALLLDPKAINECLEAHPIHRKAMAYYKEAATEANLAATYAHEAEPIPLSTVCKLNPNNITWYAKEHCKQAQAEDEAAYKEFHPKWEAENAKANATWAEALPLFKKAAALCPYYFSEYPDQPW
jgi:hypothetical protein